MRRLVRNSALISLVKLIYNYIRGLNVNPIRKVTLTVIINEVIKPYLIINLAIYLIIIKPLTVRVKRYY